MRGPDVDLFIYLFTALQASGASDYYHTNTARLCPAERTAAGTVDDSMDAAMGPMDDAMGPMGAADAPMDADAPADAPADADADDDAPTDPAADGAMSLTVGGLAAAGAIAAMCLV